MKPPHLYTRAFFKIAAFSILAACFPYGLTATSYAAIEVSLKIVDDFESGSIPSGTDGDGLDIGYLAWGDSGTTSSVSLVTASDADPLALPCQTGDNIIYRLDLDINAWGGTSHAFENNAVDTWMTQDWSTYGGVSFWLYGQNTGNTIFFDINDNRSPGSTVSDAEIWTHSFTDNFSGWKYFELGFEQFSRKEVGNGAPNDGFGLNEVHAWSFGSLGNGAAEVTYYLDNIALVLRSQVVDDFENGSIPSGTDGDGLGIGYLTWGDFWSGTTSSASVATAADTDSLAFPCQAGDNILYKLDLNINGWGGTSHAFANNAVDTWLPRDWSTYEGISFWLYGQNTGNDIFFEILDNRNPGSTTSDAEVFNYSFIDNFSGWKLITLDFASDFIRKEIVNGAPNDGLSLNEVHGWSFGSLGTGGADVTYYLDDITVFGNAGSGPQPVTVQFEQSKYTVNEGETAVLVVELSRAHTESVNVTYTTAESSAREGRQFAKASGQLTFAPGTTSQNIEIATKYDGKHSGDTALAVNLFKGNAELGFQRRTILNIAELDNADQRLVDDFEGSHPFINVNGNASLSITTILDSDAAAIPFQPEEEDVLDVSFDTTSTPASFDRVFTQGQDWSKYDGLNFWLYGNNSGKTFNLILRDNMTATTAMVDPGQWELVWSDEFNTPAGTPPNSNVWQHELGDGALNNLTGWGASELQYYTNTTDNTATDGNGNLVISINKTDIDTTDLVCWYGPCEYTSGRLRTQDRLEFEYGRIEVRAQVPAGPSGLWPQFWMMGSNLPDVGWPQSGEIDIMEYVSRLPNEIFGTIHGPGYAGGASYGNTYNFGAPASTGFHTYAVEWKPGSIQWFIDGTQYHQAAPDDVSPNEWVFNLPFSLILNTAIGGNFGGTIDNSMTFPQETRVDYVRVYQAADTAERFQASLIDNFSGWRKIKIPFSHFKRGSSQPNGAPDDGLSLDQIWGYGFSMPNGTANSFRLDRVSTYKSFPYLIFIPAMTNR